MPEVTSYWTNVAFDFTPGDRLSALHAIRRLYAIGDFAEPTCIWLECPLSALVANFIFKSVISRFDVTGSEERAGRLHLTGLMPRRSIFPKSGPLLISEHIDRDTIKYWLMVALNDPKYISDKILPSGSFMEDIEWADNMKPMMDRMILEIEFAVWRALMKISVVSENSSREFNYSDIHYQISDMFYSNSIFSMVPHHISHSVTTNTLNNLDKVTGPIVEILNHSLEVANISMSRRDNKCAHANWPPHLGSIRSLYGAPVHALERLLGVTTDNIYAEIDKNCGGYRMLEFVCFVSEKPTNISFENGLPVSITYASGWVADKKKETSKFKSLRPNFADQDYRYESLERDPGFEN